MARIVSPFGDAAPAAGGFAARFGAAWSLVWRAGPLALSASAAVAVLAGVWPVAAAWLTKLVLDELSSGHPDRAVLSWLGGGLAVIGLLTAVVPQFERYLLAQLRRKITLLCQAELFSAVNRCNGLARFEHPDFHDRLRLAQQAGQSAALHIVMPSISMAQALITTTGFVATLALLNPALAVVVVLAGAPAVGAELVLGRQRNLLAWRISPLARRQIFYGGLLTNLSAAKEVRLLGLGGFLRGRLLNDVRAANDGEQTMDRREMTVHTALNALTAVVAGVGLVWVISDVAGGRLSVGDVAVFVAAVAGTQAGLAGLIHQIGAAHEALLMFGHYLAVVRAEPDLPVVESPSPMASLRRGIELRDVWFRYDDSHPWVLRGVNLFLPHGATVGLVGLNGSGKSTLVKLLCRFYDPQRGAVLWDGRDIRAVDPAELRDRMAAVFQDCVAYDFTAAENIGVGDLAALTDRPRIRAAAVSAGIDGALSRLPRGYETMLTRTFADPDEDDPTMGVLLSGGQWQRVALARAFLRGDRDLVILDEPSAGLDAEAEHHLHAELRRQRAGRTSLLISHRLNTMRSSDLIVVLADGRIAEQGTHAALIAAGGEYARLFSCQADGYQLVDDR